MSTARAAALVLLVAALGLGLARPAGAWRQEIFSANSFSFVENGFAVVVDGAGNAVSAGASFTTELQFTVVKHAAADGAEIWRYTRPGIARAVVLDGSGDVLAAGNEFLSGVANWAFVVVKLDGATGAEIWRTQVGGATTPPSWATNVAVDSLGDVVACGRIDNRFALVKLSGVSGAQAWLVQDAASSTLAYALTVSTTDEVYVSGSRTNGMENRHYVLRYTSGGSETWRHDLGTAAFYQEQGAIRLDTSGDVFVAGASGSDEDFIVAKLAGADGSELWLHHEIGDTAADEVAFGVALTSGGDAVAVGRLQNRGYAIRLNGTSGAEIWHRELGQPPYGFGPSFPAAAVALDSAEDVLIAGSMPKGAHCERFAVFKLAGATGDSVWQSVLTNVLPPPACTTGSARGLAVDASDDVLVTGVFAGATGSQMLVEKLDGFDGSVGPVPGKKLVLKDRLGDPTRRKLVVLLKDTSVMTDPAGSAGDPILGGAAIRVFNPTSGETGSVLLPPGASFWTGLGNPAGSQGYKYLDASGVNGPCKLLLAKRGKLIKAVCSGAQGSFPVSLDEASQGSLSVSIQLGTARPQCATFGGVVRDAGTSNPGPNGSFVARSAYAPLGDCAEATTCKVVAGVRWCYDPNACGAACNDVCAALGLPLTISDATWFAAQDTPAECQAIASAFGIASSIVAGHTYACLEDWDDPHTVGGGLNGPLLCSTDSNCPGAHRTQMDQLGVACGVGSRRSICPCQ